MACHLRVPLDIGIQNLQIMGKRVKATKSDANREKQIRAISRRFGLNLTKTMGRKTIIVVAVGRTAYYSEAVDG